MRTLAVLLAVVAALASGVTGFVGGMTVERRTQATFVAAAALPMPAPAPGEIPPDGSSPLNHYVRATLALQCYEAAGRAISGQNMGSPHMGILKDCLSYVEKLP